MQHVLNIQYGYLLNKYLKCGVWRLAVRYGQRVNDLYSLPTVVRVIKWRRMRSAGHVARMGRGVYRVSVGKPEGRRPLGKLWRRWENNIKMNIQEVGYGGMAWIALAQDRDRWRAFLNAIMNLQVP
jgi:hypothetical protein